MEGESTNMQGQEFPQGVSVAFTGPGALQLRTGPLPPEVRLISEAWRIQGCTGLQQVAGCVGLLHSLAGGKWAHLSGIWCVPGCF